MPPVCHDSNGPRSENALALATQKAVSRQSVSFRKKQSIQFIEVGARGNIGCQQWRQRGQNPTHRQRTEVAQSLTNL